MSKAHEPGQRPVQSVPPDASPRGESPEEVMAAIWAEVLELDTLAPDDDFFELGGDSLSALQILTRISQRFAFKLTEAELFTARTIRGLCALLQQSSAVTTKPIEPVAGERQRFPTTSAQRRLWFLDQLIPNPEVYNVPFLIRMQGDVDTEALRRAFEYAEQRHEILRTHLETVDGQPVQVVGAIRHLELPTTDVRDRPERDRRPWVLHAFQTDAATPIPLHGERLYRLRLYRTGVDEYFLGINMHHAITDGWSWGVYLNEVGHAYEAIRQGNAPALAPLPIQYGDVAAWQHDYAQSEACRAQIDHWKHILQGPVGTLELPFSKPRPKNQTFTGKMLTFELSKKLLNAMDKLSRQESVTRYMIGLAAFQTVLHRYTGMDDLLIGSPVANRTRREIEPLVGMFVNTLILRTNLGGQPTFRTLLERVRQTRLAAFAHQDVPLETLLEELRPPRDPSRQPFFQTAFYYQNVTIIPERLGRHPLSVLPVHNGTSMFDLRMVLEDGAFGRVWGWLEYNCDLYDEPFMQRMIGHFLTVLEAACANPTAPIAELPLLPTIEREQILRAWNDTPGEVPIGLLHDAFTQQAARTPEAVALVSKAETWTYGELNTRANQFAHYLRASGVQPGELLAVHLPRTPMMVAAVLGIVKAGAAYVPLDRRYPAERLAFMVADSQSRWVITDPEGQQSLPATVHTLNVMELSLADFATTNPDPIGEANPLAYVIYTSGSTGQPKGVVIRHRSALNTIEWVNQQFLVTAHDRLLFVTSLSFDLSVYDLFGVLGTGASVRIADEEELRDPAVLAQVLREEAITIWDSAPAALQQLVPFFQDGSPNVRLVLLSGDWIPVPLPDQVRRAFPQAHVVSLGGATEASIWSNWYPIEAVDPTWPSIPYGKPIRQARYHVLNNAGQPQPIGVPGELFIGGACLAEGYWRRPELTAERFIPDPFTTGERLYRTGDLARYLPDGNLQFLGRLDHQVKVRGFRVEIGEIEATLTRHPAIQEAIVQAFRHDGIVDLTAFVVARQPLTNAELTRYLRLTLPDYMVPATFAFMDQLPMTANGKVDRAALQPPTRAATTTDHTAPHGPLETTIAAVFEEVLHLASVGRAANFFELGGHSLKAAEFVARLEQTLGLSVKLATLFDQPTVAGLAAYLQQQQPTLVLPPTRRAELHDHAPIAPMQRRFWLADRFLKERASYNVCDVLHLDGPLDRTALQRAFAVLVERQPTLRTVYRELPTLTQVVLPEGRFPFAFHDLCTLVGSERTAAIRTHIQREAREPFDLANGPLGRVCLLCCTATHHVLVLTMHHIATDEASREPLYRTLWQAYAKADCPAPALRYLDYAVWEREQLQGPEGERALQAWRTMLADAPAPVTYPTLLARPAKMSGVGATVSFSLSQAVLDHVVRFAQQAGCTPFVVYTAAWQALLARVTGHTDICVATPTQGRPTVLKDVVGCFVNTLPLRTSLHGSPTFLELVQRVRQTVTHALAHGSIPFDQLVEELQPTRGPDGQAFAQTAILHDHADVQGQADELRWRLDHVEGVGAKFDLTLGITDTLTNWLEFRTDLYDVATAERIATAFTRLLEAALHTPTHTVPMLPCLAAAEEDRLRHDWAGTVVTRPATPNLVALLEEQAQRTPHAPALLVGTIEQTYAELHAAANRLARYLRALGVGPETLVGVCLERTAHLPMALLAVLKAGGAYVPLDPAYPHERLAYMVDDAQTTVLLTQTTLQGRFTRVPHVVCLDVPHPAWQALHSDPFPCPAQEQHAAYVIYTSGSTGKPKGVVVEQRSAIEFVHWGCHAYTRDELAGVLFSTSICFDLSIFELFVTLSAGGTVVLAAHALQLPELPNKDRVTLLNTVPSAANELVRTGAIPASVRTVNLAGEPLPLACVQQLYAAPTITRVCNLYGPTEDTTYSTAVDVQRSATHVTIGRPLPNTRAYVLDAQQGLLPIGVPGELYLGGDGLARGYHRRPELTAEKFITHPIYGRLYRTGDLVRWLPDGTLDYLGRLDHQVKIRGFRIELGEVENALLSVPGVQQAVVVAQHDAGSTPRLFAYLGANSAVTAHLVRDHLKRRLPDYMVPSGMVIVPELPLTPNGKIDRHALPPITPPTATIVPPADDAERALLAIWQEVLRMAPISVTATFEEVGGHSLAAAAIMARITTELGHKLPLETLFTAPTIRQLADVITQKLERGTSVVVPLNEAGHHAPLFLIAGAGGHVFAFHKFSRLLGPAFPVYGMKAIGVEGNEEPVDQIEAIAARYLDEILHIRPTGPYVLGGYSVGGLVAYELALQMQRRGLDVARVIAFDTYAPGYPRKRAWPLRMAIHAKNFLTSHDAKWAYLAARYHNVRDRVYRQMGLGHLSVPEPPGVGGLSALVLRRVWAALDRARLNYWPAGVLDGRIVVMRSDQPQQWAATTLDDPHLGWNRWSTKPVQAYGLPAGHMELFGDANIDLLVADMKDVLQTVPYGRSNGHAPRSTAQELSLKGE